MASRAAAAIVASFALSFIVGPMAPAAAQAPGRPGITVGPNVRVSTDNPTDLHLEYLVGAHPADPNRMLACSMIWHTDIGLTTSAVYATEDRGRRWRMTREDTTAGEQAWDPACTFGPGGTAFFIATPFS